MPLPILQTTLSAKARVVSRAPFPDADRALISQRRKHHKLFNPIRGVEREFSKMLRGMALLVIMVPIANYVINDFARYLRYTHGLPLEATALIAEALMLSLFTFTVYLIYITTARYKIATSEKVGEIDGVPVYRRGREYKKPPYFHAGCDPPFRAIFIYGNPPEEALRHELAHLDEGNKTALLFSLALAFPLTLFSLVPPWYGLLPFWWLIVLPMAIYFIFYMLRSWKVERRADIYGFGSAEKFRKVFGNVEVPKSRLQRLKDSVLGLLSLHPPLWLRAREEYYDKSMSLFRVWLKYVFYKPGK